MSEAIWDVIVVGAGMAGASVGWQLAQAGRQVLVLERESQPGYHTTGRSAALFEEHYGPLQVQALTRASRAFYEQPPAGFTDYPILHPRGVMYVGTAAQKALIDAAYAEAVKHSPDAQRLDGDALRALVPVLNDSIVDGFVDDGARDIDVHALHQGFLRGMRQAGGQLWCNAEVSALALDGARRTWTVTLADGRTAQARTLVNAAGAWADHIGELAGARAMGLVPARRSAFTFPVPEGLDATHWPAVISADERFYFKPDAGQLLGSPANADATYPHDVQPEEEDIATGIWNIEQATTLSIRRPSHTWAGLRSFVADGEMVIGWDSHVPEFFWVAAQGGYGIQSAAGYSLLARNLLLAEPVDEQLLRQGVQTELLAPARLQK
ncbi:FAD-dependent oxidoreductase [Comamonas kerstersii]|uniref:FAD-dependent oxidoreductase n=1 Tax=Comamonas kerstersii TaxID=225992 RepID=A0A1V3TFN4_9BURK|nr:FAD-dependent oxidoreductase [Comamonas kerstersii]AQZ97830.1 FAD-dependent oxidoreductase [Comamonas kerstersii]KAB0586606.1 FAD-binding oxidoreductase [Comamonas kerstersii]OOH84644.1 FAD-dependent oxidoreductase [Comamonas kerstersii]OOH90480.1 FAD-dependent oxidoreductase [Comamonas kerstersii]